MLQHIPQIQKLWKATKWKRRTYCWAAAEQEGEEEVVQSPSLPLSLPRLLTLPSHLRSYVRSEMRQLFVVQLHQPGSKAQLPPQHLRAHLQHLPLAPVPARLLSRSLVLGGARE